MTTKEAALFFDYENIHIGMETTFGAIPNVHKLSACIREHFRPHGEIIIAKAYGDWERFKGVPAALQGEQIEPVYIGAKRSFGAEGNLRPGVAKNAADIQLALDAYDLLFTRPNISTFILVSGDYDFVPLVIKLHSHSKMVCLSSILRSTSRDLRNLVGDDFVSVDELLGLIALKAPGMPTVDWYALIKYLDKWEAGPMPFIARKLLQKQLPPVIVGQFASEDGRNMVVGEALAAGILDLHYVPNPKLPGTQTAAVRLNRNNEFVESVLGKASEGD